MKSEQPVNVCPSNEEIETRFNTIWPELESRAKAMSQRYKPDAEEAEAEALASMAANFVTSARRGKWIPPTMLAHFASARLRVGRQLTGNAINDPLSAQCRIFKKANALHISRLFAPRRSHALPSAMAKRLVDLLTSDIGEDPAVRVALRLDWAAFMDTQPRRIRQIINGLAEGRQRNEMAKRINVSPGRLTQIMDGVKLAVLEFFGEATPDFFQPVAA
ncbi:MAG: hypothetical protein WCT04_09680 [Planctomycetota bacterium]